MRGRGFTLLETMLAAAMASMVVLACVAIMYSMNRTDQAMEVRADQRSDLGRIRTVMERTFSSLLMNDEPQSLYNPEATDGDETGQFSGRFQNRPRTGINTGSAATRGAAANTVTAATSAGPNTGASTATGAKAGGTGAANGESTEEPQPSRREPKPPPPPRVMLGYNTTSPVSMRYQPVGGVEAVEVAPQRLEVVLHRSPVPQAKIDVMEMPLPPRTTRRTRAETRTDAPEVLGGREVQPVSQPAEGEDAQGDEAPGEEATLPVRAIRGAFELHPQPPRGYREPGVPVVPAPEPRTGGYEPTGLWELWWIPLPPADSEGVPITRREAMYAGLGRPYFVAGDLKYARWTAFFRKNKRGDLVSTWSSELPAYMELQVETSAGLQSNWMFEIDWANGPEVARRPEPTADDSSGRATEATRPGSQPATRVDRPATRAGGGRPSATRPTKPGMEPRDGKGGK